MQENAQTVCMLYDMSLLDFCALVWYDTSEAQIYLSAWAHSN